MDRLMSSRIARTLSLVAAVALPGCVIEGGYDHHNNLVDNPPVQYAGCPALNVAGGGNGLIGLTSQRGGFYSIESLVFAGEYVQHYNGRGIVDFVDPYYDGPSATFRIVPGLADSRCISFESANYKGYYLNEDKTEVFLDPADSSLGFAEAATFCPRPGLADPYGLSFEACALPGHYLNDDKGSLYVDPGSGRQFSEEATFLLEAPF